MKIRKFFTYIFACAFLFCSFPCLPAQAATVEQLTTEMESIEITISDEGEDLSALTIEDILVTLDGAPISVTEFAPTEQGINYMFLLDISGSVPDRHMNAAKEQILSLYTTLREQDQLSVITFGDEVHTIIEGTETVDEVQAILDTVRCDDSYTHFYDAINLILQRIDIDADIQNIAIIVSDGINTGDVNISIDELYTSLNESNITLYALAVDAAKASDIDNFREFVQLSGGQLFEFNPSNCTDSMSSLTGSFEKTYHLKLLADPSLITGESQALVIQIGEHSILEQEIVLELPDTTAPTITGWEVVFEDQTLSLFFSEPMANLQNPEQYRISAPDGSLAPVTVVEHTDDHVLLKIEGLDNLPGWRADFDGLKDASSNGNTLKYEAILITPEIVEEPTTEEPTTEDPVDKDPSEFDFILFIKAYWYFILAGVFLLLALFLLILVKASRKKKDESLVEFAEDNDAVAESDDTIPAAAPMIAAAPSRQAISGSEGARLQRTQGNAKTTVDSKKKKQDDDNDDDGSGVHMSKGMAHMGAAPQTAAATSRRKRRNIDDDDDSGVHMSKGMAHIGAVPTKNNSGDFGSGDDADKHDEVHVNEHKRERRGLLGLFRSRKAKSEEVVGDEDLGVAVNEPLHGVHAPTRKVESEKVAEEYEVDLVSNHRRSRKVKRVRRGWFTWQTKDIPEAHETEDTEESTLITEEAAAHEANEAEYIIDKKTARKYIKPRKTLLKRKMKPLIEQNIPKQEESTESAPEEAGEPEIVEKVTEEATTPAASEADVDDSKSVLLQGDAIKSGGFDLSGISVDYRPGLFSSGFGDKKLKKKLALLAEEAEQASDGNGKLNSSKKNASSSSVRAGGSSSKQKNISFTFSDEKKK